MAAYGGYEFDEGYDEDGIPSNHMDIGEVLPGQGIQHAPDVVRNEDDPMKVEDPVREGPAHFDNGGPHGEVMRDFPRDEPRPQPVEMQFTIDTVSLDLDTHVGTHQGMIKLQRLQHVIKHCPPLRVDALKMALKYLVEQTSDVGLYGKLYDELKAALQAGLIGEDGDATLPRFEEGWVRETKKNFDHRMDKLDHDLKNYKTNSIKESIRRGYDEIGNHCFAAGDATAALKAFNKSRDYGEGLKEQAHTLANRLKACVYLRNFPNPSTLIDQMKDIGLGITATVGKEAKKENNVAAAPTSFTDKKLDVSWNLIKACIALYHMSVGDFQEAADLFVTLNPESCEFPMVLTGRDIAIYGGICAVATYDRQNLKDKVISNKTFKSFLESAPEIRKLVETFNNSKFCDFIKAFGDLRSVLLLDMLLAPHVDRIFSQSRKHGIIEFFRCYASVELSEMAREFRYTQTELQEELMKLILSGQLPARIDSVNQLLNRDTPNVFMETAVKIQQDMDAMRNNLRLCLIRTNLARRGLVLRSARSEEHMMMPGFG